MNLETSNLTVTDPLAEQEVAVVVRILPDNAQRPARTALLSVGTAGRPPVFMSGVFEDVADLICQAWLAYGVQVEMRQSASGDVVAEAVVGDDSDEGGGDETLPAAPVQPQPQAQPARPQPRPQPQNLTLF